MKSTATFFSCLLIFNLGLFAQDSVADSLRNEGQLQAAIEEYSKLYRENPENKDNTYNYACALALKHQIDSAFHYLNIATEKDSSVHALNDPDLYYLTKDERWSDLENNLIEKVEAKHGAYKNLELSKNLWTMKVLDQAFYYHLGIADKMFKENPVLARRAFWEIKTLLNKQNVKEIEAIIAEKGWPKSSEIGESAAQTVFLVIQHADIDVQKKYLPLMKEAANQGEARLASLALLIDRVNLREGKSQIYGSQIYRNEDGVFYVKDLENPEYVNQRRKEVGLGPIEEYVSRWGINWDIEQKEK